jgi:diguanylate cyclase (GGDEF)-like protein
VDTADAKTVKALLRHQTRPLLLFGIASLAVLAAMSAIAARALLGSYDQLENEVAQQRAEQIYRAFDADLRQLAISNRDYAEWDAAQEFIVNRDPEFISGNFSGAQLLGMHVDVVWITAADGGDIHSAYVDRASGVLTTPAPTELIEPLRPFVARAEALRGRSPAEATVATARGLMGVSAVGIRRSDGSLATGAVLVFARLIAAAELQRVYETSRLPVALAPIEVAGLPREVGRAVLDGALTPFVAHAETGERIASYAVVRDVDGNPVAVLRTEAPRDIRKIGVRTTSYLLGSVVALFGIFGVICFLLIARLVALQQREFDHRRSAEEQQRQNRRNLAKQAQRDFLTGLPNRLYAQTRVPRLIAKMADSGTMMAVIYVDIDRFKSVNESRGHGSGDDLLKIIAKRLRAAVSKTDLVARMGGDEFVVVASLLPDMQAVERLARRLRAVVAAEVLIESKSLSVTASLGVALYPRDGVETDTLLKRADIALHQAKEAGRRCHRYFSADMDARVNEDATLEHELRGAVGTEQIYLDYQPIVDLRSGRLVSLEALMRWRHPERGLIPPAQFIPVGEKCGLILELGQRALQDVLAQQREWLNANVPVVPIAVNVSAIQIERVDFVKVVKRLTSTVGVDPKWVRFEITESAMMKEPEKLIGTLQELRALGSQVLLDDFGTGYSSLSYLNRLPIDIVKIDRAFVRELSDGDRASPVIPLVVDMAKQLGLKTVAEGVETAAQAAGLFELGCDFGQGYFYSKPVSAHHCRSLLEHLEHDRNLRLSDLAIAS